MDRRRFILALLAGAVAASGEAEAQDSRKSYRIGHISSGTWREDWPAFVEGLNSLGWVEGRNIVFERREHIIPATGTWA